MRIGEVIRTYRKSRNLTQEEMARRLGVTAPAVNKWENNVSLPDITLLAPIARVLETTPDTLLSFREELAQEEVRAIVLEAEGKFQKSSFAEAFDFCRKKICQYPGCSRLILHLAMTLDGWRILKGTSDPEKMKEYDREILGWYKQALESEDSEIRERAADALFSYYYRNEDYEKAEACLSYFSRMDPVKKIHKAQLCEIKGDRNSAFKEYEELLFQTNNVAEMALGGIFMLAEKDGDFQKARMITEKMTGLAELFESGEYHKISAQLQIPLMEKDREKVREYMKKLTDAVEEMDAYRHSELYEHMEFKELSPEFVEQMKTTLSESFRKDPVYGFVFEEE